MKVNIIENYVVAFSHGDVPRNDLELCLPGNIERCLFRSTVAGFAEYFALWVNSSVVPAISQPEGYRPAGNKEPGGLLSSTEREAGLGSYGWRVPVKVFNSFGTRQTIFLITKEVNYFLKNISAGNKCECVMHSQYLLRWKLCKTFETYTL